MPYWIGDFSLVGASRKDTKMLPARRGRGSSWLWIVGFGLGSVLRLALKFVWLIWKVSRQMGWVKLFGGKGG